MLESDWQPISSLPDLNSASKLVIDLETRDDGIKSGHGAGWATGEGYIAGVALATPEHGSFYLPIRHEGGGNLNKDMVLPYVEYWVGTQIPKICHNAVYDCGWLHHENIQVRGPVYDTMYAAALLDENRRSYSLDSVAGDWCGVRKDESLLDEAARHFFGPKVKPKEVLWKLPARFVGPYAEQDGVSTLALWENVEPRLRNESLWQTFQLECDLIPLLIAMRKKGIRVDTDKAQRIRGELVVREKELLSEFERLYDYRPDVWSAASLARLFDKIGLFYPRTARGAPSFLATFLESHQHPVTNLILQTRKINKAVNTFIDGMVLGHEKNGRIHCELHPLRSDDGGTVSGRFCISEDTVLETSRGKFRIGDYEPTGKDTIETHLGNQKRILRRIYKGREPMYSMYLGSGAHITGTGNHQVLSPNGWVSLKNLSVGEEVYVHVGEHAAITKPRALSEGGEEIHDRPVADVEGDCGGAGDLLPHDSDDGETESSGRGDSQRAITKVFARKSRGTQPDEGEDRSTTPQLQRSVDVRISDCENRNSVSADAPPCNDGSLGTGENTQGVCCSPHRRGHEKLRLVEPLSDVGSSTPPYARKEHIEKIIPVGEKDVWDIEVEDDHSYVAQGLFHHNSCSNPNLQQVPARDPELGPLIRGLFLPEKGQLWGALDYSSQEPRLTVHYAAATGQPGSGHAVQGYQENERMDYHQMVADLANISRKHAKVINLGLAYGMGGVKLCHSLGLPTVWGVRNQGHMTEVPEGTPGAWEMPGPEGVDLLKKYHANVPFVKGVNELCVRLAQQRGWIKTYYNRLCRFDLWEPIRRPKGWEFEPLTKSQAEEKFGKGCVKRAFTHKALNRLIQGSAADMTKLAMRDMWREGIVPMMTMHDELDISTDTEKLAKRCESIMRECVNLSVPVVVDCEFGKNWGEAKYTWTEAWSK